MNVLAAVVIGRVDEVDNAVMVSSAVFLIAATVIRSALSAHLRRILRPRRGNDSGKPTSRLTATVPAARSLSLDRSSERQTARALLICNPLQDRCVARSQRTPGRVVGGATGARSVAVGGAPAHMVAMCPDAAYRVVAAVYHGVRGAGDDVSDGRAHQESRRVARCGYPRRGR